MTGKIQTIGSRSQVWHKTAKKTAGGLIRQDLMMNKHGRIVSRNKHASAKKEMRLLKHGYGTRRGKFGFVKLGQSKSNSTRKRSRSHSRSRSRSRSHRGGGPAPINTPFMMEDVVPQPMNSLDRALVGGRKKRHRRH